jgi:hypothetical protein
MLNEILGCLRASRRGSAGLLGSALGAVYPFPLMEIRREQAGSDSLTAYWRTRQLGRVERVRWCSRGPRHAGRLLEL